MTRPPVHTRRFAAAGLLLAGACGTPTAPGFPVDAPPTAFDVEADGFGYGTYRVTLRGDTLVVYRSFDFSPAAATTTYVVPTRDALRAFWRSADDAAAI